ncbi:hypothetical protein K8U54_12970 [Pseudomonas fulva]|uniref:hypothetical protein n=1 Tax=Pseudomonas fulva TaxID=47880 RepID=UPI00201D96AB|nr:hypothetical protein [Pseudomonas fulva]UQY32656.1 hypothetical protein K8U54_12970 [Pseudomonas fulva]
MATNIEKFDNLTGKIFADLYQSFPVVRQMAPVDYFQTFSELSGDDLKPNRAYKEALEFFVHTVDWLKGAGYLDVKMTLVDGTVRAVLTAKGLETLKQVPNSLGGETIGDQLAQAAKNGLLDKVRELVGTALGKGIKLGGEAMPDNWQGIGE